MEELRTIGVRRILLLTEDRPPNAQAIAAAAGIADWRADMLPENKVDVVRA